MESCWSNLFKKWRAQPLRVLIISGLWLVLSLAIIFNKGFTFFSFDLYFIHLLFGLIIIIHGFSDDGMYSGSSYRGDPFGYLRISDEYLHLGSQKVALSNINKIALSIDGDKAYLSLPYNHLKGQAPTVYFDKGLL